MYFTLYHTTLYLINKNILCTYIKMNNKRHIFYISIFLNIKLNIIHFSGYEYRLSLRNSI